MIKLLQISLLLLSFSSEALTFSQAKTKLKNIYKSQPESFYCGCGIKWQSKKKLVPVTENCGYTARNEYTKKGNINQRAKRIEWEHVVPAWEFGHQLQCWQKGGRKNCSKTSIAFKNMEGDLHNLVPAIGEVNAEVNFKGRIFEPAPNVRGNIARTYFYFEQQHGLKISKKQKQLYTAWDKLDPVDKAECAIHAEKSKILGNHNPFVASECG